VFIPGNLLEPFPGVSLRGRDDTQFSEKVGYHDPDQEDSAGYPDEREKGIACFFEPWLVEGPDGKDIDKEAEAQSEKKADDFYHGPDTT
jgi:hypothetical protein